MGMLSLGEPTEFDVDVDLDESLDDASKALDTGNTAAEYSLPNRTLADDVDSLFTKKQSSMQGFPRVQSTWQRVTDAITTGLDVTRTALAWGTAIGLGIGATTAGLTTLTGTDKAQISTAETVETVTEYATGMDDPLGIPEKQIDIEIVPDAVSPATGLAEVSDAAFYEVESGNYWDNIVNGPDGVRPGASKKGGVRGVNKLPEPEEVAHGHMAVKYTPHGEVTTVDEDHVITWDESPYYAGPHPDADQRNVRARYVTLDQFQDHKPELLHSLLVGEDRNFKALEAQYPGGEEDEYIDFQHTGVDPVATLRGLSNIPSWLNGSSGKPAVSTIEQQLIDHVIDGDKDTTITTPAGSLRVDWGSQNSTTSLQGKVTEGLRAMQLARDYPKELTAELYANMTHFSQHAGLAASSQALFDKPWHDLNANEIAALTTKNQNPTRFNCQLNDCEVFGAADRARRSRLKTMKETGIIADSTYDRFINKRPDYERKPITKDYPDAIHQAQREIHEHDAASDLPNRQIIAELTIDERLQETVQEVVDEHHTRVEAVHGEDYVSGGLVLLEDGEIGATYTTDSESLSTSFAQSVESPGSMVKPMAAACIGDRINWLASGERPQDFKVPDLSYSHPVWLNNYDAASQWLPGDAQGRLNKMISSERAIKESRNVAMYGMANETIKIVDGVTESSYTAENLEQDLTACYEHMGMQEGLLSRPDTVGVTDNREVAVTGTFHIGTALDDVAAALVGFMNQGEIYEPHVVDSLYVNRGETIDPLDRKVHGATHDEYDVMRDSILSDISTDDHNFEATMDAFGHNDIRSAAKTGTTHDVGWQCQMPYDGDLTVNGREIEAVCVGTIHPDGENQASSGPAGVPIAKIYNRVLDYPRRE